MNSGPGSGEDVLQCVRKEDIDRAFRRTNRLHMRPCSSVSALSSTATTSSCAGCEGKLPLTSGAKGPSLRPSPFLCFTIVTWILEFAHLDLVLLPFAFCGSVSLKNLTIRGGWKAIADMLSHGIRFLLQCLLQKVCKA